MRLFSQKGFSRTTIDEIASSAEVSRSTFFRYFGSKESVLLASDDEVGHRFLELIKDRPAEEGPLRAFEQALLSLATDPTTQIERDMAQARQDLLMNDPTLRAKQAENLTKWTERLAQALAERDRERAPGPAHRLASWVGVAIAQEMGQEWRSAPHEPDSVQLVRDRFALLRALLDEPPARRKTPSGWSRSGATRRSASTLQTGGSR